MLRFVKKYCGLLLLLIGAQSGFSYALLGPFELPYQVPVIFYQFPGDIGGPHNIGEEFRRTTPVVYYSYDQNFLDYFASNGVFAIDQAMGIMNGLTNVSLYTGDLSEFPLEAQRSNFRAAALQLLDLKSVTLSLLAEQLGLAEPVRYTWTLHDRLVGPGGCPANVSYTVIKRNFDPVFSPLNQLQPSSYVNGTLYSYAIFDFCTGNGGFLADAVEFPVDPLSDTFTAVADFGLLEGNFYTGWTRDDVGGLRYLWRTNNLNIENAGAGTLTFVTNNNVFQLLVSSNLSQLVAQSLTSDTATLLALYPDLLISDTTTIFTNVVTTNITAFFFNDPLAPAGSLATLKIVTNFTTNVQTRFSRTFANVVTNSYATNGFITILETNITQAACGAFAQPGQLCTNITTRLVFVPGLVTGDFFIIPTNSCSFSIVSMQLVTVIATTNLDLVATNAAAVTNVFGEQFSRSTITYFTNRTLVIHPVECVPNSVALRQGMEKITFVRRDFDSLLGQFFYPITNTYIVTAVTNNTLVRQTVQRVVTTPDFLMTADDLATTPADNIIGTAIAARNIQFDSANVLPGLVGPGTIDTPTFFTFNKVGPIYFNTSPDFLDEASQIQLLVWGSFDGTTNDPVVYPNGTSIENLENQVLIQVSPSSLSSGSVGSPYSVQFSASGGAQAPFAWSLSTGSAGLPPGLTLSSLGLLSGTPTTIGTFDFAIRMTDVNSRFVDRSYAITINP